MFDPDDIANRQAIQARHMADRLNTLAERVFEQAVTVQDPEAVQAAALTVERLYRGVRLCMGYEAKVVRDHRRARREIEADALETREAARTERAVRLKQAVGRAVLADYEADHEDEDPSEDDLRQLSAKLAAVVQAVDGALHDLDPEGDFDADVAQLLATLPLLARMAEAAPPQNLPPRSARWRGSG